MFLVYTIDDKFAKITYNKRAKERESMIKVGKTSDMDKAAYWTNEREAKSWDVMIKNKFPNAELKQAKLTLI